MTETKKIKELFPGDLVLEKHEDKTVASYIVLSRRIPEHNAQYYYVEYECLILYYSEDIYGINQEPGGKFIIDSLNLEQREDEWVVMVESGLSWDDYSHNNK